MGGKREKSVPMLVYSRNASMGTPATIEVKIVSSLRREKIKTSIHKKNKYVKIIFVIIIN